MTGVLPIAKYSTGSELNMFREYNFMNDTIYEDYFGFDEKEVKELTQQYPKPSFEVLKNGMMVTINLMVLAYLIHVLFH